MRSWKHSSPVAFPVGEQIKRYLRAQICHALRSLSQCCIYLSRAQLQMSALGSSCTWELILRA